MDLLLLKGTKAWLRDQNITGYSFCFCGDLSNSVRIGWLTDWGIRLLILQWNCILKSYIGNGFPSVYTSTIFTGILLKAIRKRMDSGWCRRGRGFEFDFYHIVISTFWGLFIFKNCSETVLLISEVLYGKKHSTCIKRKRDEKKPLITKTSEDLQKTLFSQLVEGLWFSKIDLLKM